MKCPECEGKGYKEYEAGLIQVQCRECNGTGEIPDDNPTDGGTGSDNQPARGADTGKPKQPKKQKAKRKARKRSS